MTISYRQLDLLSGILPLKTDSKLVQDVCLHEPPRFWKLVKQFHKLIHDKAVWAIVERDFLFMEASMCLKGLKLRI